MSPMTLIMVLLLAALLIAGATLILKARGGGEPSERNCPGCRASNPRHARFCSKCGNAME